MLSNLFYLETYCKPFELETTEIMTSANSKTKNDGTAGYVTVSYQC